jgi:hypothetical protein
MLRAEQGELAAALVTLIALIRFGANMLKLKKETLKRINQELPPEQLKHIQGATPNIGYGSYMYAYTQGCC